MNAQTYLYYDGRCEEALRFYAEALGAETIFLLRFKDAPANLTPPGSEDKIFHSTMRIGDTLINASDNVTAERPPFSGFSILLNADSKTDAEQYFARLAEGGTVKLPIDEIFRASIYGILTDKFGIEWKVQAST